MNYKIWQNHGEVLKQIKNTGISRKLCNIPISTPVKCSFSITKLFSNTIHTENTNGIVKAMASNKCLGWLKHFRNFIIN